MKTVGGSTKYFVYNGMNIVYEYTESVADGVAYFYGLNRTHNSEGEIYLYNAHGDVVQLVKNNAVVASYTYDAFGNLTSQIGESDNPFLYCGEYYDAETQTYYLRARYYNPANGRFTQQDAWAYMDASDPLSLNLYAYCGNNPIMYVDPSGNFGTAAAAWGSSMFWLCAIDAALPIGDIIYGVGLLIAAGVDVVCSIGVENTANLVDSAIHIRDAAQQGSDASKKKGSTSQNNSNGNGNSPRDPKDPQNWNKNSTKLNSKTLYDKKGVRVDVENPDPSSRPGQVHIQIKDEKYIFDNISKQFFNPDTGKLAPKSVQKLMEDPQIAKAVMKGVEKYLGLLY